MYMAFWKAGTNKRAPARCLQLLLTWLISSEEHLLASQIFLYEYDLCSYSGWCILLISLFIMCISFYFTEVFGLCCTFRWR
jgi:hypothetical protein